jgi:hypothetical protein
VIYLLDGNENFNTVVSITEHMTESSLCQDRTPEGMPCPGFLDLSDEPFDGADTVKLIENLQKSIGGGNYLVETFRGVPVNQEMWLCEVTEYVFAGLPELIYVNVV